MEVVSVCSEAQDSCGWRLTFLIGRDLGSKVTEEQRAQGVAECEVFRDWVAKHVLTRNDEGHGEAVILLPLGNAKLDYRDIVSGFVHGHYSPRSEHF